MSSSSQPPDQPGAGPRLDIGEIEEAEQALTQELRTTEAALGGQKSQKSGRGIATALLAAPGTAWMLFYLVAPVTFIVLVSFWTQSTSGFEEKWTLDNYERLFSDGTYWRTLRQSIFNSLIVVGATFVMGLPIAYFLAMKVKNLRNQIALFIVALAPFWTSALIRVVAWRDPLMGRSGAVNEILLKIGIINEPLDILSFSNFSVVLAMIQLYVLFMITPLFFMLAQVDRSSLEAARDLGANWFKSFREVVIPQIMPGVVIGSIFIFVLSMGEFATVRVVGGNTVASVGTIIRLQNDFVQFPTAAASAVVLVVVMMLGVVAMLRFANLREDL
jgi:putative spermidine/putrescine transport system permease protein